MSAVFDQFIGSNQSKVAGTSLIITPVAITVTVGKTIFLAYAGDDVGSAFGVTDSLGNTYSLIKEQINTGDVKTQLWSAPVTTGGLLATITVAWTTNVTAKAAVAGEFSNFGTQRLIEGNSANGNNTIAISATNSFFNNELWIGACGVEDDAESNMTNSMGTPTQSSIQVASNGTTGGSAASNIFVSLGYVLINADSTATGLDFRGVGGNNIDNAGAGAIYNPIGGGSVTYPGADGCGVF